ncbi:MAG: hypothetical protein QM754_00560 [Tepidisphaeraceae bacterium]
MIRKLAIQLNDGPWWQDNAERTAALLPLAKKIVGTRGSLDTRKARAKAAANWALIFAAPLALELAAKVTAEPHKTKLVEAATKLRENADAETAREARAAANAAAAAANAAAANAAYAAADAAAYANANAAADAANAAYAAADAAAYAAAYAKKSIRESLKTLIEQLCEIRESGGNNVS